MTFDASRARHQIETWAALYGDRVFDPAGAPFHAGRTYIPASGKVIGGAEISNAVSAALDGWFTEGAWTTRFETSLARWFGVRHASLCNSGSSANLLALAALMSPLCPEGIRLKKGDGVLVAAAGFPTTLNPVLQLGLEPVFVDVEIGTYVPSIEMLLEAIHRKKPKAAFLAHTLGNPVPMAPLLASGIAILEDNCDAVGAEHMGQRTGTIGHVATVSFYPAHHMTTGEGGAVLTSRPKLRRAVESLRDWGRDCWCEPGKDNTCGKRFGWEFAGLPPGYDHKYVYSHVGYNLKATDFQAAIGMAQLDRLDSFIDSRRRNFAHLWLALSHLQEWLVLPESSWGSNPSWFGFPITLRRAAGLDRTRLLARLETVGRVGTRLLFGGNLLRQPAYRLLPRPEKGLLRNSDEIAEMTFWVGVWPGLTVAMLDHIAASIQEAVLDQANGKAG